jgi:hypothetical protein
MKSKMTKSSSKKAASDKKFLSGSNSDVSTLLRDETTSPENSVALNYEHETSETSDGYLGSLVPDVLDFRDRIYNPSLRALPPQIHPPLYLNILDQKTEGACAGFALAAVLNLLARKQGREDVVSARMLYEMAKKFDDWPGEDYVSAVVEAQSKVCLTWVFVQMLIGRSPRISLAN